MLVTSAVPSEGKSTVAANLAAVLSQAGSRVALVICDFRLPAAERFFELDYGYGLSDVLDGRTTCAAALQRPEGIDNLWVLTSGAMPPNPSELPWFCGDGQARGGSARVGRLGDCGFRPSTRHGRRSCGVPLGGRGPGGGSSG